MTSQLTSNASSQQITVFPPDRGIGVLAVYPPYPVGFKPQKDGALGINIHMVQGDRDGLLVYILAYIEMAVGDDIRVFIENTRSPVAQFSVTAAHFDDQGNAKNIPFHISAADMQSRFLPLQIQSKDLWFEVKRFSKNTEESPHIPLLYKYPAPGEADTDGGKPFNQGLKLPVASEGFVDQTVIDDGMFVTVMQYFNQHIGDVVVLAFGSLLLETTVTALGDVMFELTPDQLATLAPTNTLMVRWEVFDVVENASGWSDSLVLPFKPGIVLLAAPIFEQADIDNILHHDQLDGGTAGILVTGVFAANDRIELTLQGVTQGGETVNHTYNRILSAATRTVDFPVENEKIRNLIGGALHASYQLIRAGKSQFSKPADVTVSGVTQPLGLPLVAPLVDGKLPVDTAEATVQLAEYWPLQTGATVEARWQTTDKDGVAAMYVFRLIVSDPSQPVIFKVPAKYIAPFPDTPLVVQCTVANPGQTRVFSELLQLRISEQAVVPLDPPTLVKPALTPIDVLAYPDGVTVRIEYVGAIKDDRARLVEVKPPAGSPAFPLAEFNSNKRVNTVLTQAFLAVRQGRTIEMRWNLNRNGGQAGKSLPLALKIQAIPPQDSRLPTPQIRQGAELDINKLQTSDRLTVTTWPGEANGQRLWLRYDGVTRTGPAEPYNDLVNEPHTGTSGLNRALPLEWLKSLKHDSELKISFWVNLAGDADFATAILFPVRTYLIKSLSLTAPKLLDLPGATLNFDDIADSGARIEVPIYTGMSPGQSVKVELAGAGGHYTTASTNVDTIKPLIFLVPRSTFIANAARTVAITYLVSSSSEQNQPLRSPSLDLNILADTWRDSITDFNGNAGNWALGPASRTARILSDHYENLTYDAGGNSGVMLSQTFQFKAARTYQFSYYVANVSPQPDNVPPVISVSTSSGMPILGAFTVPRTGTFFQQVANFRVPVSGAYTIYMLNHEDRGGYGGARGGNDFILDAIHVRRL